MTLKGLRGRGLARAVLQGRLRRDVGGVRLWRAVALVFVLTLPSLSAGCLFPPVATPVELDDTGTDDPTIDTNVTPVYEQRFFLETQTDTIEAGLRLQETEHGSRQHIFDLPERLDVVRVYLEWNHTVYDLDLAAVLQDGPGGEQLWVDNDTGGSPGEPDAPVTLEVSDRSKIFLGSPTQLRVTVSSDAGADVSYTLTVRATYLIPAG